MPKVLRDGRIVVKYDSARDEVTLEWGGNRDYLRMRSDEKWHDFIGRVVNFADTIPLPPSGQPIVA